MSLTKRSYVLIAVVLFVGILSIIVYALESENWDCYDTGDSCLCEKSQTGGEGLCEHIAAGPTVVATTFDYQSTHCKAVALCASPQVQQSCSGAVSCEAMEYGFVRCDNNWKMC